MLLLYLLFFGIIGGVAASVSMPGAVRISLLDISVGVIFLYFIFNIKKTVPILKKDALACSFLLFLLVCLLSLVLSPLPLTGSQYFISLLYIVRLAFYFSVYPVFKLLLTAKRIQAKHVYQMVVASGVVLSAVGWIQYFLYPDLRNLYYLGWDPHYKRIFSTFLDPNFLGIYLVISLGMLLFNTDKSERSGIKFYLSIILLVATIFFTYSRSSLLSLGLLIFMYVWKRSKKIFLIPLVGLFIMGLFLLPRPGGEGVKLERLFTVSQRLDHAWLGFEIFSSHPFLGVGFDALRYAKARSDDSSLWLSSHAGAGLDISLLFILATTGVIGFFFFLRFIGYGFYVRTYSTKIFLFIILLHSLFVNSLFFPFSFILLWLLFAVSHF